MRIPNRFGRITATFGQTDMGRLVIFTENESEKSVKAVDFLNKKCEDVDNIKIVEINLTTTPSRKKELKKLTAGKVSPLPQIFFNTEHIGGYEELMALKKTKKLKSMLSDLAKQESVILEKDLKKKKRQKKNKRSTAKKEKRKKAKKEKEAREDLAKSKESTEKKEKEKTKEAEVSDEVEAESDSEDEALERKNSSKYPEIQLEELDTLYEKLRHFETGMKLRGVGAFNKIKNCFKGFELVMWLMTRLSVNEDLAIDIGQKLLEYNYMHRVKSKEEGEKVVFRNSTDLYKFYADDDDNQMVINMKRLYTETPNDPPASITAFANRLEDLLKEFSSEDKKSVDYTGMTSSKEMSAYINQTLELQRLDLDALDQDELLAFFLNLYNGLSIHGIVAVGRPANAADRATFFDTISYLVGGHKFSLYDMKHGILRANKKPPGVQIRRFSKNDPRTAWTVEEFDPMIHFGLVCGTKSCPRLQVYRPETVRKQLTHNTALYCNESTSVLEEENQILIARTFGWFHNDFGETDTQLLEWVHPFLYGKISHDVAEAKKAEGEVRCGQWEFALNSWHGRKRAVSAVEEDENCMIVMSKVFRRETGKEKRMGYLSMLSDRYINFDLNLYREYFYNNEHENFLGTDEKVGSLCISFMRSKSKEEKKYRILIRTKEVDSSVIVAASSQKQVFDSLKNIYPFLDRKNLEQISDANFKEDLVNFESKMISTEFKFGVLYYKDGQTEEDDMFGNEHDPNCAEYEEFLGLLGKRVALRGWKHYAAGLDVETDRTGTHSVYTNWNDYELMFHVSTLLPYSRTDTQQIKRKMHLGNDAVLILFHSGTTRFNPACITSRYNQVYVVVTALPKKDSEGNTLYSVNVASKADVPEFPPFLPNPPVFALGPEFREFLLNKIVNGLKAALKSPSFATRVARSRSIALNDYVEKYCSNKKKEV